METLSQLSDPLVTVGVVFFLSLFIVLGVVKGLLRLLFGAAGLVTSAVVFWWTAGYGRQLAERFVEDPEPWLSYVLAGILAFATYILVRHLLGLIFRPLLGRSEEGRGRKLLSGLAGLGLGALLLWGGAQLIQRFEAELFLESQRQQAKPNWTNRVLPWVEGSWLGRAQETVDFFRSGRANNLAKLLAVLKFSEENPQADREFQVLADHPPLQRLLNDPQINEDLENGHFQALMKREAVRDFLRSPESKKLLRELDWSTYFEKAR